VKNNEFKKLIAVKLDAWGQFFISEDYHEKAGFKFTIWDAGNP